MDHADTGTLHHLELWVPNLARSDASWGWLLGELGYQLETEWPEGKSWRCGPTYIVLEQSPARIVVRHDRLRPGLNHVAFHVGTRDQIDKLVEQAPEHGWRLMFGDRHPHAGGPGHYAAYLEDWDGYEVELVGPSDGPPPGSPPSGGPPSDEAPSDEAPPDGTAPG